MWSHIVFLVWQCMQPSKTRGLVKLDAQQEPENIALCFKSRLISAQIWIYAPSQIIVEIATLLVEQYHLKPSGSHHYPYTYILEVVYSQSFFQHRYRNPHCVLLWFTHQIIAKTSNFTNVFGFMDLRFRVSRRVSNVAWFSPFIESMRLAKRPIDGSIKSIGNMFSGLQGAGNKVCGALSFHLRISFIAGTMRHLVANL